MKVVRLLALRTGRLYSPTKYSWYTTRLQAESTPGPQSGRKDYVNEDFQRHYRDLPTCSSVHQRNAPPRAPHVRLITPELLPSTATSIPSSQSVLFSVTSNWFSITFWHKTAEKCSEMVQNAPDRTSAARNRQSRCQSSQWAERIRTSGRLFTRKWGPLVR